MTHASGQSRQRIDRHARRLELADFRLDDLQVILKSCRLGIGTDDLEHSILFHLLKINPPAGAIAQQLGTGFLIGKQDGSLLVATGVFDELGHQHGFAGSRGTGGQDDRILEEASTAHVVQAWHTGADPHIRRSLSEPHGTQRKNADAVRTHGEREFSFHVSGAAQLEDLHRAPTPFSLQNVAQDHDVVGDEFLNAVARNRPVLIDALGRHQRGDTDLLEPGDQAEDLTPHHENGVVLLEHGGDRIDRHPLCLVLADGVIDPFDQAGEIEVSRDILAIGIRGSIQDEQLVLFHHLLQVPAETGGIAQDVERRLLEGDEDSWLVEILDAVV